MTAPQIIALIGAFLGGCASALVITKLLLGLWRGQKYDEYKQASEAKDQIISALMIKLELGNSKDAEVRQLVKAYYRLLANDDSPGR